MYRFKMLRSMGNTQLMFIRESDLMFRTFAQFLFKMIFFQRGGGVKMVLEILQEWGRVIFLLKKWKITQR